MRNSVLFICLSFLVLSVACEKNNKGEEPDFVETKLHTHRPVIEDINANCAGYYIGLPGSYEETKLKYPLIISLHGWGALGGADGLGEVVTYSIGSLLQDDKFPKMVAAGGKNYSFIVVTPRFKEWPVSTDVKEVIDHITAKYRIDASRIYICGASMGGAVAFNFGGDFPNIAAAIVPFAAARKIDNTQADNIARAGLPFWAFHNTKDQVAPVENTITNINVIKAHNANPEPKMTIWEESSFGGDHHDCWTRACNPEYKENDMNIYEWMLQYHR